MERSINTQSREAGIDLLRCLALLFVVGVHSFLYNGFYNEKQLDFAMVPANSARWLFYCCNGMFMMLTGYLKTQKPFSIKYYKSLVPVLISYGLICVVTFPIRHFLLGEELTLWQWISKAVNFGNYAWYLEMYIGLLLLSPMVNVAMDALATAKKQALLVGVLVMLTSAFQLMNSSALPDYWSPLYPFTYYAIGAWIRRNQPKVNPLLGLGAALLTALGLGITTALTTDGVISEGFTQTYGGFWIVVITTGLFLSLYRLHISGIWARVLAWAASGVFEGYLLSRLLDVWVYDLLPQWHTPGKYVLLFLAVTCPIYLFSVVSGKMMNTATGYIMKQLEKIPLTKEKVM